MADLAYHGGVPEVMPETRVPDDYQHIQASADAFGAPVARGLEQFGAGAVKAGQFFGQVAADDAANQFQDRAVKLLHGDPNKMVTGPDGKPTPDLGYLGLRGRAALDARPQVESDLDALLKEVRQGLQTPEQKLLFDRDSRRYRSVVAEKIGVHADQQAYPWYHAVNQAGANLALTHIANNAENPVEVAHGHADLTRAYVRSAQLQGGGDELISQAVQKAKQDGLKAQLEAISVHNPARALSILEKNREIAGTLYQPLAQQFKAHADAQLGNEGAARAIVQAGQQPPPVPVPAGGGAPPTPTLSPAQVHAAILIQESGGNPYEPTSVSGAMGPGQIMPATFRQYAQPGERIDNPADNLKVSRRIVEDYMRRYNGDPARVAVAYFSGPGNVAPEGSPAPWIRDISDPTGKSTAAYVGDITRRLGGGGTPRAEAYRLAFDDPALQNNPVALQHALTRINQAYAAAQVASDQDLKAKREASDRARDGYIKRMMNRDMRGIIDEIGNDPNLLPETREHLWGVAERKAGDDVEQAQATYGPGFWAAYKGIVAPTGDPARISDVNQLLGRAGPGGDLTLAGVEKLAHVFQQNQRSVDGQGINRAKVGQLAYAKSQLSFEADTGPIKIRDPKGEAIFNAEFIPKFEAAYDAWVKEGKNPLLFLSRENTDKLMRGMRSREEMNRDRLAATGEEPPGTPDTGPAPAVPEGVNAAGWGTLMRQPPTLPNGRPASRAQWAQALTILKDSPTPKTKAAFDRHFGSAGYSATEVLKKMKVAERPDEAAAVAPGPPAPAGEPPLPVPRPAPVAPPAP